MSESKTLGRGARGVVVAPCLALALVLTGCSYTPAQLRSEPLIVIDGAHGGASRRHHMQDDQGENDNAQ